MNNISKTEAKAILETDLIDLFDIIKSIDQNRKNHNITYSRNVFLPLTRICRNNCGYCTFKQEPGNTQYILMNQKQVEKQLTHARKYNCTEALFTFGENADSNSYVQEKLDNYGYDTIVDYTYFLSQKALEHNLLPHTNMGILSKDDLHKLSTVNASMGLMLETTNKKLLKTVVHKDSPGKNPQKRLSHIKHAGEEKIPFTTGLLIGIGETPGDHMESLFEIQKLHRKYGHIQEIIIQNFKPKKGIKMENHPEPGMVDLIRVVILAKLMFNDVSIQIPPNLNRQLLSLFILAGCDDLGGVSQVTKDYVNPELPWPEISQLEKEVNSAGYKIKERLPVYDKYITDEYLADPVYEKACLLKNKINTKK